LPGEDTLTPVDGLPVGVDCTDDIRDFISVAIVINACSTLVEFFADVSKNGIFNESAYS
jgi:hypothetical protein